MVIIAGHHLVDDPLRKDTQYTPDQDWPEDCTVQWGGNGLVMSRKGNYKTAFFEAFPNGPGFFRGEGETIEDAESQCFEKFERFTNCEHSWGRGSYLNGGTTCRHCKAFATMMKPVMTLGAYRAPLSYLELSTTAEGMLRPSRYASLEDASARRFSRRTYLRLRRAGVDLPPTPLEPGTQSIFDDDNNDPYIVACRKAVSAWYRENHLDCAGVPNGSLIEELFHDFEHRMLQRMVDEDDEYQSSLEPVQEL